MPREPAAYRRLMTCLVTPRGPPQPTPSPTCTHIAAPAQQPPCGLSTAGTPPPVAALPQPSYNYQGLSMMHASITPHLGFSLKLLKVPPHRLALPAGPWRKPGLCIPFPPPAPPTGPTTSACQRYSALGARLRLNACGVPLLAPPRHTRTGAVPAVWGGRLVVSLTKGVVGL